MVLSIFRRLFGRTLMALLCGMLLLSLPCAPAQAVTAVSAQLRPDITIIIDGETQIFYSAGGGQLYPITYDGSTYLPLRAIGELMGKNVDWNDTTKTITLSGVRSAASVSGTPTPAQVRMVSAMIRDDITLVVDATQTTFTGAAGQTLYPLSYEGSTYLPLRAIGQLMGKTVDWDGDNHIITLTGGNDLQITDADTFSSGAVENGQPLSLEAAKTKALAHAGVTLQQATFTEQKSEREHGRQVYDLEFYTADGKVYEYDIDATTGDVIAFKYELQQAPAPAQSAATIDRAKAQAIALAQVPGATATHVDKLKLERDDGRSIYEVKILYGQREYELDIDAATGTILDFDAEWIDN